VQAHNYIHTTKLLITNTFFGEYPGYWDGSLWSTTTPSITMLGERRLNNLWWILEDVLKQHIPGDFIETGVWRGAALLFLFFHPQSTTQSLSCATNRRGCVVGCHTVPSVWPVSQVIHARTYMHQPTKLALITPHFLFSRKVWLADSFQGIPPVDTARFPADAAHEGMDKLEVLHDNDINTVKGHFKKLNLLNDNIEWLGRFHDGDVCVCDVFKPEVVACDVGRGVL
jgi:hypothetical protein